MANEPLDILQINIQSDASQAADGLTKLASAMKAVQRASKRGLDVKEYADGLSELAGKVSSLNIDKLESLAGAMATIQTASRGFTTSVNNAAKAVENLNNAGKSASTAKSYPEMLLPDVSKMRQKINVAQELLKRYMSSTTPDFMKQLPAVRNWNTLPDGFTTPNFEIIETTAREVSSVAADAIEQNIGTALMVVSNQIHETADEAERTIEDMRDKISSSPVVIETASPEVAQITGEEGLDNVDDKVVNIGKNVEILGIIGKRVGGILHDALVMPFQILRRIAVPAIERVGSAMKTALILPLKTFGNAITNTVKKFTGFIRAIGRIALYRAIRSALKAITQGLNEGIQNLYQWSLIMDRTFANSMDSIATSMQYLHNGFASMFSPLIDYAAPIIEEITNKIVDLFNVIQQVFAALTGQSTWTKAVRVQKQYAEAVTETGNAADKAMHQLMAFDELNVINSPSDSGRGGNNNNTPAYGSMFTTETVDTELSNWVKAIKAFFESGDFRGLGEYVGDKLNKMVSKWTAYSDGFMFGYRIRQALEALNGFLETFNFYDLGSKIGSWIGGIMDGVTPEELASTFANMINSAISGANGLVDQLIALDVPGKIGNAIGTALSSINWKDAGELTRKVIKGVVRLVNTAMESFISGDGPTQIQAACETIGRAIGEGFASINWKNVSIVITNIIKGVAKLFSTAISSFVENDGPAKLKSAMAEIGTAIGEAFASLDGEQLAAVVNTIAGGIKDMIINALTAFRDGDGWTEVGDFFKSLDWSAILTLAGMKLVFDIATVSITGQIAKLLTESLFKKLGGGLLASKAGSALITLGKAAGVGFALTIPVMLAWKFLGWEDRDFGAELDAWGSQVSEDIRAWGESLGESLKDGFKNAFNNLDRWLNQQAWYRWYQEFFNGKSYELIDGEWQEKRPGGGGYFGNVDGNDVSTIADGINTIANEIDSNELTGGSGGYVGRGGGLTSFGGSGKNSNTRQMLGGLLSLDVEKILGLDDMKDAITRSDIPYRMRTLAESAGHSVKEAIRSSDIPGEAARIGVQSGESIKTGAESTAVPSRFKSIAVTSISEFGKQDFAGTGRNAGNAIRSGLDSSGISSAGTQAANSIVTGIKNATSALSSAGWQSGAAFGQNFKSALAQYVSTEINATIGSGASLIRAHIQARANGGYVTQGSLFLAGEVPGQAEMLGSINGRTGVASGTEITGIGEAVRQTGAEEAALLRQLLTVGQALLAKDPFGTPSSAAGRWVAQSQQAYQRVTG